MNQRVVASGTRVPVAGGDIHAAVWVRRMFAAIARRYDLLNHLLSFNIDRGWRESLIAEVRPVLADPGATVLDLCCGTGDVLIEMRKRGSARIMGADFCHPMLLTAQRKMSTRPSPAASGPLGTAPLIEADALAFPCPDSTFDAITIAFGFRNLSNYRNGLAELYRIVKPGGTVAILEFSHPRCTFVRFVYGLYLRIILPLAGGLISGSIRAYSYLPASIRRFPRAPQLAEMMREAGFDPPHYRLLTGGIAALHVASKPVSALPISSGD